MMTKHNKDLDIDRHTKLFSIIPISQGSNPIVNFKLTLHHKNFKWFTVGGTPIKISNRGDKMIKIAEKFTEIL